MLRYRSSTLLAMLGILVMSLNAGATTVAAADAAEVTREGVSLVPDPSDVDQDPAAIARTRLADELAPIQAQLRVQSPGTFGGLWIDDSGEPHIAIAGNDPVLEATVSAALSRPVVFEHVRFSERALDQVMERVDSLVEHSLLGDGSMILGGVEVEMVFASVQDNVVRFRVLSGSDADRAALAAQFGPVADFGSTTERVYPVTCTGRTNCGNPVRGGTQLYADGGATACTSGLGMRTVTLPLIYYVTSAGHCWGQPSGSPLYRRYHPSSHYLSNTQTQPHLYQSGTDVMWIQVATADATNWIYYSTTSVRVVTSDESISGEVLGEQVCSSKMSGNDCGTLSSLNVCSSGICYLRLATAQWACPGDSGSAVYQVTSGSNVKGLGWMSGMTTGTYPCPNSTAHAGSSSIYSATGEVAISAPWVTVLTTNP